MKIQEKLEILTAAAKYDVSCSSSNSKRKNKGGIGEAYQSGICHSWSEDGRCISLLKILLTNQCMYDCAYCVNRATADTPRAQFTPQEVADLTIDFYKRNYIEGLFLSSAVFQSPDATMERLIRVAEILRNDYKFYGYIHMKAIPGADEVLIKRLGSLIDRMSVNIELPTEQTLKSLAPQKSYAEIYRPMEDIRTGIIQRTEEKKLYRKAPSFVPAGQTTQMIIGAGREDDYAIVNRAESLYQQFKLKRVYYSGYVPVVQSALTKGIERPPMLREHRLYQADFLMRYYGFGSQEIVGPTNPFLDLHMDPKAKWATNHYDAFPIEVNKASYEQLIRVPGFGPTYAKRIINARRFARMTYDSLLALKISVKRAKDFITVGGVYRGTHYTSTDRLNLALRDTPVDYGTQLNFFGSSS